MKTKFEYIKLSDLKLDNQNPRLPKSVREKTLSEEELVNYLLLDASLIELILAIGGNGFFPGEQLLVVLDETDGKYRVIEGNRRLSAVKLLNNPEIATVQKNRLRQALAEAVVPPPSEIPCLIFDNVQDIHKYLGFVHITGKKEWRTLEKARYLYELKSTMFANSDLFNTAREIAKMIGSRTDYVKRVLVGFEMYQIIEDEDFYQIRDLNDKTFFFNYIIDSLNKNNIKNFLGVDFECDNPKEKMSQINIKKWTHWLYEKNDQNKTRLIGNSSDLSDLNAILGNERALNAFDEKGYSLHQAKELTGELDDVFKQFVQNAVHNLEKADNMSVKVQHFYDDLESDFKSIKLLSDRIKWTVQNRKEDE